MLQVGQIITSKTNPNKKYEVKEVNDKKATLSDIKTGDEKELKLRTIERNYNFADAQPESNEVEEQDVDTSQEKTDHAKEEKEKSICDGCELNDSENSPCQFLNNGKCEKEESDKEPEKESDEESEKEPKKEEKPKDKKTKGKGKGESRGKDKGKESNRGRKPEEFEDIEEELYTKTVTEIESEDGKLLRTETYIGKGADWRYVRCTKNNSFHKATLEIAGEDIKLESLSKSRAGKKIAEAFDIEGFKLK